MKLVRKHNSRRRRITCEAQRFPACTLAWKKSQSREMGGRNEEEKKRLRNRKEKHKQWRCVNEEL